VAKKGLFTEFVFPDKKKSQMGGTLWDILEDLKKKPDEFSIALYEVKGKYKLRATQKDGIYKILMEVKQGSIYSKERRVTIIVKDKVAADKHNLREYIYALFKQY
jgi:hypothetical protein